MKKALKKHMVDIMLPYRLDEIKSSHGGSGGTRVLALLGAKRFWLPIELPPQERGTNRRPG